LLRADPRFLEALPEPDAPDAPGAPLHGARPLLAVVPGDAAAPAAAPPPAPPAAQRPRGALAAGADCDTNGAGHGAEAPAQWGGPGCDGGHLQPDAAPGGPGLSAPGPGGSAAAGGGGGDAAAGRVALYSLRRHCYVRELTFSGRVRPGAPGAGRVRARTGQARYARPDRRTRARPEAVQWGPQRARRAPRLHARRLPSGRQRGV